MAPEQAAGDSKTDHRADLYAFGALAYEVLGGTPPFDAASVAQLVALHWSQEPAPLSKRRPSVPAALEALVMRCLQKRPADRWQSAREILAALDHAASEAPGSAREREGARTATTHMTITEAMARRLERRNFDPRMIGDTLEYLDNRTASDVLVMLINAVWLDSSDFEPHLRTLPFRCIAPTLYGFTTRARHRFTLSLRDHMSLLTDLLQAMVRECNPALLLVVGFSASGDLALMIPSAIPEGGRLPDGILALGPNQGMETCFLSRAMARLETSDPARLLPAFRRISETASTLDDWIIINSYLGRIMDRFRGDVSPLRLLGRDIIEPFERDETGAFAAMYREATSRVRLVRCLFEDSEICNRLLRKLLMDHMDHGILGAHHRDGSLLVEATPSHFEIAHADRVGAHLTAMVEELRAGLP
jgi:hypothetical protein